MRPVQVGEPRPDLGPQHPQQRLLGRLDHRHLHPGRPSGCGGLQADPPGPDDEQPLTGHERRAQPFAVRDRPQVREVWRVAAGDRQPTRARSRC